LVRVAAGWTKFRQFTKKGIVTGQAATDWDSKWTQRFTSASAVSILKCARVNEAKTGLKERKKRSSKRVLKTREGRMYVQDQIMRADRKDEAGEGKKGVGEKQGVLIR